MTVAYVKHDDVLRVFTELMIARKCTPTREALAREILNEAEQICAMVRASFGEHDIKPVVVPGGADVWPQVSVEEMANRLMEADIQRNGWSNTFPTR